MRGRERKRKRGRGKMLFRKSMRTGEREKYIERVKE
jgi:hypothetical protein